MNDVRLKDIAKEAGFSVSTVSRILSGDRSRKMRSQTIDRVLETARRMGYYEEKRTRLYKADAALDIGCLFVSDHESILSPFFSQIYDGIKEEVAHLSQFRNVSLELLLSEDDDFSSRLESGSLDAAIILGRARSSTLGLIRNNLDNLIYAGLNPIGGMDEVLCDARDGMAEAVRYLHGLGHERIAFVGPTAKQSDVYNEFRYLGYQEGMAICGLGMDDTLVEDVYLTIQDGYEGARALFSRTRPTAVLAANDNAALGVLSYLKDADVRVPDEVSVVGFDNIEVSSFFKPSLSTYDVPKKELGRFAVKFLIDRIDNPRDCDIRINVPYRFIERDSSGRNI